MSAIASLALTFLALVLLHKAVASRRAALAVAIAIATILLLLITYFFLDSLTGSGIDESVMFHLNTGLKGAAIGDFAGLIALTAGMVVAVLVLGFFATRFCRAKDGSAKSPVRALAGFAALAGAFAINPAVIDILGLVSKYGTGPQYTGKTVPAPPEYVSVDAVAFEGAKKNLVLFYLESIERTFLDDEIFPGLAPNLAALEQDALSFSDISQVVWSSWTIAGMVASQCGIPLAGSGSGADEFLPAATCVGDLLGDAGYDLSYMGGASLDFAGKGTFYRTHGFTSVEGNSELLPQQDDPGYESLWGVYDDSLLRLAARRFDAVSAQDGPFGMALITVDTHHPGGGIVSATCEDVKYRDGSNAYLNAVHCADKMAGHFIRHVLASPAMDDTLLVVLSDHIARPNTVWDVLEAAERRNLVLAFGAGIEPGIVDKPGTTIDVAPTILGLLGAPTEALGYGRDLLGPVATLRTADTPLDELLEEHWPYLTSLWAFPQLHDGIKLDAATDRAFLGARYVKLPVLFQLDEDLNVVDLLYDMDDAATLPEKLAAMWYGNRFVWVDTCERIAVFERRETAEPARYCAFAGNLASPGLTTAALADGAVLGFDWVRGVFQNVVPDKAYYDQYVADYRENAMLVDADILHYTAPSGLLGNFAIRSAGGADAFESWIINRDQGDEVQLKRGLTLLGLTPDATPVKIAHKDTCAWGGEVIDPDAILDADFGAALAQSAADYGAFAIVGHSSVVCYKIDPHLEELFAGTEFVAWRDVWYEQPYVAVLSGNGHIEEFVGERNAALAIELRDFVRADADNAPPVGDDANADTAPGAEGAADPGDDQSDMGVEADTQIAPVVR